MSCTYLTSNLVLDKLTNLNHLKQLHAQLIHHSLHHDSYYVAQLISHCTRLHAPPHYTAQVFDSAHQPDEHVFTSMLKHHSKHGENSEKILTLFHQMQMCNVQFDHSVYPIFIKAAGKSGYFFHGQLIKVGIDQSKYIRNALLNLYGKYGPIEAACKVFDEMSERSVADWNAMISGYWNWGKGVEAKGLFDMMLDKNVITWTAMVSGCAKMKDLESARRYFDQMPEKNVVSWNAMIKGYAQNGLAERGLILFGHMLDIGIRPDSTTLVAVISSCSSCGDAPLLESLVKMIDERRILVNSFVKTTLIDAYAKLGNIHMARKIFDEIDMNKNPVTWNAMISGYTRVGDLASAKELFDKMPEKNLISWNSMIAGYAQNGQSALAIELFKAMIRKNVVPDEVTLVSIISACGHLGALELGNWVVSCITKNQIKLSVSGYNSLIFMYSKCGSMDEANKIFHQMEAKDVVSYNAMITGFAAHGHGSKAIDLMMKMKQEGLEPDRITYIGVLTACSQEGLLEEGRKIFESIESPDEDHYACMVDLLGRLGELDEAKGLIDQMPMDPHAGVYGSLLNAGRVYKRIDLGEFAANKLFDMEPNNSGNYVLLSNMYASAGRWKDVQRVRLVMKQGGVVKGTGLSWVEHDGKMHKFTVGDRSHELSDKIYELLAEMKKRMKGAGYVADQSSTLRDVEEEDKEEMLGVHSEKLAVAFALLVSDPGEVIRVVKNLRICSDCHSAMKMISKLEGREIVLRDNNRFHCFKGGSCSCNDYW